MVPALDRQTSRGLSAAFTRLVWTARLSLRRMMVLIGHGQWLYEVCSLGHVGDGQDGAVAQLGERCVRNAEVEGSNPFRSISFRRVFLKPCF
jgi:hypothetical protein